MVLTASVVSLCVSLVPATSNVLVYWKHLIYILHRCRKTGSNKRKTVSVKVCLKLSTFSPSCFCTFRDMLSQHGATQITETYPCVKAALLYLSKLQTEENHTLQHVCQSAGFYDFTVGAVCLFKEGLSFQITSTCVQCGNHVVHGL